MPDNLRKRLERAWAGGLRYKWQRDRYFDLIFHLPCVRQFRGRIPILANGRHGRTGRRGSNFPGTKSLVSVASAAPEFSARSERRRTGLPILKASKVVDRRIVAAGATHAAVPAAAETGRPRCRPIVHPTETDFSDALLREGVFTPHASPSVASRREEGAGDAVLACASLRASLRPPFPLEVANTNSPFWDSAACTGTAR